MFVLMFAILKLHYRKDQTTKKIIHLILNNVNCYGLNDEIFYSRNWITGQEGTNTYNGSNTYIGCDYFEGNFNTLPVGDYEYIWEVTKNNITTYHSETFTLTEGDSNVFQIDY